MVIDSGVRVVAPLIRQLLSSRWLRRCAHSDARVTRVSRMGGVNCPNAVCLGRFECQGAKSFKDGRGRVAKHSMFGDTKLPSLWKNKRTIRGQLEDN